MPPRAKHFRRPPWWPENEPWPPHGPAARRVRSAFVWRILGLFVFLFVFGAVACGLAGWLAFAGAAALDRSGGTAPLVGLGALLLVGLGIVVTGRVLMRVTMPVGDLMEAAGRVEAGDYSARVHERGPREVRRLVRAFNNMTGRLQSDEAQRRRLLADITHELRTPLSVIQGHLEGVLDGVYPADAAHLRPILDETRVLSHLIEDLRTLSLAESGALRLHREPTDLAILLDEALAAYRAPAREAGLALRAQAADDLPLLDVDPVRVREVLSNLIANALRHTPRDGSITVSAALEAGGRTVRVTVRDTGAGIAPEALPHIFDRFYKAGESRGMGLGLAIARNLVGAHGGEITAESEVGRGTTIQFTLPVA